MTELPQYIDAFVAPVRDSQTAQLLTVAVFLGALIDIITGFLGAASRREVKSAKMRKGMVHKFAEFILLAAADLFDGMLTIINLGVQPVFVTTATILALMELVSICENCILMNPDLARIPVAGEIFKLLEKYMVKDETQAEEDSQDA